MKKLYTLLALTALFIGPVNAQDINFDPASMDGTGWIGYMTVFNLPAPFGDEAYQFEGGWGTADLVAQDNMDGTVTLKPNRIGDPDPYWQGANPPGNPTGNKMMEATYYLQDDALAGTDFTFNAEVISNTLNMGGLDVGFTVTAFIKVFPNDFSSVTVIESYNLADGNFTLTHVSTDSNPGTGPGDTDHIQYGFTVYGPNVRLNTDPMPTDPGWYDDDYDALGGILVGPNMTLSTTNFEAPNFRAFPNPTQNSWTIKSNQEISEVQIFDMLGKKVMTVVPNTRDINIDANQLSNGIYFAQITSPSGINSIKLVKE
ncbi:MAG: T9SS type A sorting domain-containing protein [Bacteroidia bacterium]|nr:T9SS type A sorting domain-containing protein [Bacteroidia bacterium]NND53158.1 T9SS type A sorting domain-containing protein [Flavobacteriaceae bacterium]